MPGEPLLTWDGWNSSIRAWIAAQGEAVAIVDVIDVYAQLAGEFDKWPFDRIGLKYRQEADAFLREQEKYTREVERVFGA